MFDEQPGVIGGAGGGLEGGVATGNEGLSSQAGSGHHWYEADAHVGHGWREIDRAMRTMACRRAALDAEEARLLVAARTAEVHRHLGYGSFEEYLERALGHAPRTARDRVRVASALEALPAIGSALAAGSVTFSAVRELTRVATGETERAWLDAIEGLTAREIEDAVRGHAAGDHPNERPDPTIEPRGVRLELAAEVYALFLEARRALEADVGQAMTDSDFMAVACRAVLGGGMERDDEAKGGNVPPHQIAMTVCVDCKRGWQDAAGHSVEVEAATIDRAQCDAAVLGRVDGATPEPVKRTIPAAVRRMVLARDRHRCQVPGCRSARFVDVHHLRHRADGGGHEPRNCLTLCSAHHGQVHAGRIVIDGVAGALRVSHADGRPYGARPSAAEGARDVPAAGASEGAAAGAREVAVASAREGAAAGAREVAVTRDGARAVVPSTESDAYEALVTLGFRAHEAKAAVATAVAHVGRGSLEVLLTAALRACPRSRANG